MQERTRPHRHARRHRIRHRTPPNETGGFAGDPGCRGRAEIEAESVAYIICHTAGLTTAAYSFGYVAHWSAGLPANVKATAERVVTTARTVLERTGLLTPVPAPEPQAVAA